MNRLEEFISTNKSLFDEEPAAGHFERLQQKMNRTSGRIIALRWGMSIAASIAIVFSVWQYAVKQNGMEVCENATDMKICYLNRMDAVVSQIETLISDFDQWDRQEIMNDVQDIIDAVNGDFESELPDEIPDDMAKAILADYYRKNLEGMEMIVQSILHF
jgi:hypothetical protein